MSNVTRTTKNYNASGHGFVRLLFKIDYIMQNIFLSKRYDYFLGFSRSIYNFHFTRYKHGKFGINIP